VAANAPSGEDARVWVGRVQPGSEAEHERFLAWLNSPEAHEVFRRRRLTEYILSQEDSTVTIVFRAPHTGDPRIMIDFLRYPGLWPDFWDFHRGGNLEAKPDIPQGSIKVHWRREFPHPLMTPLTEGDGDQC
jgi:hypothetical protein